MFSYFSLQGSVMLGARMACYFDAWVNVKTVLCVHETHSDHGERSLMFRT